MAGSEEIWLPLVDEPVGNIVAQIQAEDPEIDKLVGSPHRILAFRTFAYIRVGILLGELLFEQERTPEDADETWVEALVVLSLTAIGALIVFLVYRHPIGSPWKVAGTNVQDVSRAEGIQTEIAAALDPRNPRVLFAASNESLEPEIRVYSSTNGGKRWSAAAGPAFNPNTCAWGDPSVAIAANGRQYVAFTEKSICIEGPDLTPYLVVASRPGPRGPWTVRRVTRPAVKYGFDDKPAIAVGADGRAYVAWSRLLGRAYQTTVLSSSGDGGRTWSSPKVVDGKLVQPQLVALAAGSGRTLYVAGVDTHGLWIVRSTDGGRRFTVRTAAPLPGNRAAPCLLVG